MSYSLPFIMLGGRMDYGKNKLRHLQHSVMSIFVISRFPARGQ